MWCVWCGWHDWSWCNSDRSMRCSVETCIMSHMHVFLSQWAWWNCQTLSHNSGKVGRISHLNCIHMIRFDMIGIGAIVMGWWGYREKVCVHIHVKQFDRTRLGAKVAGVSSYSIFFLEWLGACCSYYCYCSYYNYYWSLTHAMHGPIEQHDED